MLAIMLKIKCITNLHVGNGDVNYNIIDNEVEKDPVTCYPMINASGVKGALREHFSKSQRLSAKDVDNIFGSESSGQTTSGKLKFLDADMLTVPMRASSGDSAYYMVSTNKALDRYVKYCKIFFGNDTRYVEQDEERQEKSVEGVALAKKTLLLDEEIYLIGDNDFKGIPLPVVARNKLENGISKNLWYEEIVPHESVFYFPVIAGDEDKELLEKFRNAVNKQVIQFGANASIGYGLCMVTVVEG